MSHTNDVDAIEYPDILEKSYLSFRSVIINVNYLFPPQLFCTRIKSELKNKQNIYCRQWTNYFRTAKCYLGVKFRKYSTARVGRSPEVEKLRIKKRAKVTL